MTTLVEHDDVADDAPEEAPDRSPRSWITGVLVVAFLLRLGWLFYAKGEAPTDWLQSGDQFSYWYYGNELAAGRGYVSYITHQPTAYYPVGFPMILATLFWFADHSPLADHKLFLAGLMHVTLSTATVWFVYLIGRRLFTPTAGLVAAGLLAVWPNAIYQVTSMQVETMFVFWAMAALTVIVSHDWSTGLPSRNRLLAFGVVLGVSAYVRPFSIWFLLGLFLAALAVHAGWKKAFLVTLVPTLVIVVMTIPWIVRNEAQMDAFIPTSTNTGDTLCLDRNSTATGGFRFADHDGCADPNLPEVPRNSGNTRKAIEFVTHHPGREALQIYRRALLEFGGDHDALIATDSLGGGPRKHTARYDQFASLSDWYFRVVGILALAGLPLLVRRPSKPERRIVLVAFGALLAIPLLLWGNERFHFPLVPFLAISAGAAAVEGLRLLRGRRDRPEPAPTPASA